MSGDPVNPAASSLIPYLSFFLLFFLLPVAVLSAGVSVRNTSIPQCYSVSCGDGVEIRYPLWYDTGPNTSYCGYSKLGIECDRGGHPVLKLGGDSYRITGVSYDTRIISLQDLSLLDSDCPRPRHNLTLDKGSMETTDADSYLYFLFNCSSDDLLDNLWGEQRVPCLSGSGSNNSYVFPEGTTLPQWSLCQDFVVVPVLRTAILTTVGGLLSSLNTILRRGFEVTWQPSDMEDCVGCEKAGGNCGYASTETQGYEFICLCNSGTHPRYCSGDIGHIQIARKRKIILGISAGTGGFLLTCIMLCWWLHRKRGNLSPVLIRKSKNSQNIEAFLKQYGTIIPKRYGYAEVKKITKSFTEKLGQGGFGAVFKGKLLDGRWVAVKVLKSKESAEEFINEVASIGRTHHINIVRLLGFCCEGPKRALLYEFMPNGSLEKFIFFRKSENVIHLGWEKLLEIAIGIARGLEYLHRGCNTRIVHFDIKPHNILLDEDFCPKISDFGLAKSCRPKESILSTVGARGTIGYIAPEVFSRHFGAISSKSDVYSYGMMVLEMVGGRASIDVKANTTSDTYFPHWIYDHFNDSLALQLHGITNETEEVARKMILVGLWCIQTSPSSRPPISKAVEMLEGSSEGIEMPPKPYLCSP